jgi:asparagine synthase (glutamine-hydrolysing)
MFDKAAAGFSIELRYPFLDRRLLEFCLAVPASQKLHRGWNRMIMRRAMKGILPEEIRWRGGKATLTPNFNRALLMFGKDILDDIVLKTHGNVKTYVDFKALRNMYGQYLCDDGKTAYYDIWSAVTLALWLRCREATSVSASAGIMQPESLMMKC